MVHISNKEFDKDDGRIKDVVELIADINTRIDCVEKELRKKAWLGRWWRKHEND